MWEAFQSGFGSGKKTVLILVCVEVSVGDVFTLRTFFKDARVLILVCVEVSVGDCLTKLYYYGLYGLNPCLCGS